MDDCRGLPPLHETYRADQVAADQELSDTYELIVGAIAPYSDVLLCETMASVREARAAAAAADRAGLPVWVAYTLAEDGSRTLRSGEEIDAAVAAISEFPNVQAVMLNCSSASTITNALPRLIESSGDLRTGAYANGFSDVFLASVDAPQAAKEFSEYDGSLTPDVYAHIVDRWRSMGADIVGGCCGIFPEHLSAVTAGNLGQ